MPKIIDSSEISVGDPLIEDFWPIFAEKFSTQKFCEWRFCIKRVQRYWKKLTIIPRNAHVVANCGQKGCTVTEVKIGELTKFSGWRCWRGKWSFKLGSWKKWSRENWANGWSYEWKLLNLAQLRRKTHREEKNVLTIKFISESDSYFLPIFPSLPVLKKSSSVLPSRTLIRTRHVSAISQIKIFQTNQKNWKNF